ncbi:MAG: ribosome silencing factor [Candidatus Riflebacteria bacterium HGW-Riflebacteria-2]|nr:MAG: ribosome silencing factor [Candidatus Riflebacteria bacterium HGW-Riflebacteria-2]
MRSLLLTPEVSLSKSTAVPESIKIIIEALKDKKVEDLVVLDLIGLVPYTDYFIIGSGNSSTHVQTLADTVAKLIKIPNVGGVRLESDQAANWILIDGGEFVLHLFQPKARKFYNLEDLWEDAPQLEV